MPGSVAFEYGRIHVTGVVWAELDALPLHENVFQVLLSVQLGRKRT
jgi:hypothetical protein